MMTGAVVAGDAVAVENHPSRKLFDHDFNSAFP